MNFQGKGVSKAGGLGAVVLMPVVTLACLIPGKLKPEDSSAIAPPATAVSRDDAISCAHAPRELHFAMLAADATPDLPSPQGLQVCLAVYRLER